MYADAKKIFPPKKSLPFNLQLGKLYSYSGELEILRSIQIKESVCSDEFINENDIVLFLTKPEKSKEFFYCKILSNNGFIGYVLWDKYTHNKFTLVEI